MFKSRILNAFLMIIAIVTCLITIHRSGRGSNDFDTYYNAGRAVLEHSRIYFEGDYSKDALKGGPFLYAPIWACFFALIAWMPIQAAAVVWNLFNFGIFLLSLHLINQLLDSSQTFSLEKIIRKLSLHDFGVGLILLLLLLDNLTMAQSNILILGLILGALAANKSGKPFLGGIILSGAILIKLTPLLFCVYFAAKRSWKALIGTAVGGLILTLLIPTLVFGYSDNRLNHRQWLGRMLKPTLNAVSSHWKKLESHPQKMNSAQIENIRLANLLTAKNQALEATLTRLFLKDRNGYAFDPVLPIYSAQRYRHLPVLIGIDPPALSLMIRFTQGILGLVMLFLIIKKSSRTADVLRSSLEVSLVFLSMTLFSPLTRSHQFIFWSFALVTLLYFLKNTRAYSKYLAMSAAFAAVFYLLQAVPYGKAAGMGTWSNLVLWGGFAMALFLRPATESTPRSKSHEII